MSMKVYMDRRVVLGFSLTIIVLMAFAFYSYRNNRNLIETREWVFHTTLVLFHIERANSNALKIQESIDRYVLSGDTTMLNTYRQQLQHATNHFVILSKLTHDNPSQHARLDSLAMVGRKKIEMYEEIVTRRDESNQQAVALLISSENQDMNESVESILSAMREEENNLLQSRIEQGKNELVHFEGVFFAMTGFILIILITVFFLINRGFRVLLETQAKTNVLNNELEAFTYSVSHDLRAPLRSIRGFSEMLKEDFETKLDKEGNRLLGRIIHNASRMGQLIDDLLDFSRIGRKQLTPSVVRMQFLVSEVLHDAIDHDASLQNDFHIKPLAEVTGDANMLKQVWINLISNAVKYSRKSEAPVIEIGNFSEDAREVYYVRDNGIGFDMKYSDKLFQVFQRLHNSAEFEGTGVGLAIVHRIITKHDGTLWAEAEPGKGATFFFSLPKK